MMTRIFVKNLFGGEDKENVDPEGGFQAPKRHQRKASQKAGKMAKSEMVNLASQPAERDPNGDWNGQKVRNLARRDARNTLANHDVEKTRNVKAAQEWVRQNARVNNDLTNGKVIGKNGVQNGEQKATNGGVKFADQQVGTIMWRFDFKPLTGHPTKEPGDEGTTCIRGVWYYDNGRFWIIIIRNEDSVVEVPILTHKDTGLEKVPKAKHNEYLNLKPKNASKNYKPQNNKPILEIATDYGKMKINRETMVVRIALPDSRELDRDELIKVGALGRASVKVLVDEFNKIVGTNTTKKTST
ncbi:hypothetical protein AC578_236 [Pseudocercospora eumusae]|uniref:Uncharacterized protein n=1 Tax=Pseudocercospora eumusae TaxID=321146 RepID=A0A139HIS5_9PEZI|nr:hypothetical protein AC578_236 [Pseudocercospora eumusae]